MKKVVLAVAILLFAHTSFADSRYSNYGDEDRKILGLGTLISTSPYVDEDTTAYPIPIIVWEKDQWFIDGTRAGYILYEQDEILVDTFVSPRLMGYDNSDSPVLDNMKDRDFSIDGGMQLEVTIPELLDIRMIGSFTTDLLAEHGGHEAIGAFAKTFKGDIFEFTPKGGVKWQSENLTNHYYGVRVGEAITNREAYNVNDTVNYFLDLNFNLGLSEEWILVTVAGFEWLNDEITDSPIVDSDDDVLFSWVVGLAKRF